MKKPSKEKNMPGFDGTGPLGMGPGTGRGLGPCGAGMAWRRGRGSRGFGFRRFWDYAPYDRVLTKDEEKEMLKNEASILEEELAEIKSRLKEIEEK